MSKQETMIAAVFEKVGVLNVKEVPKAKIKKSDDVLIKVEACSICGTDSRGLAVPPQYVFPENMIIGHELVGIVEEVGNEVNTVVPGDRVVIHPNLWCGNCQYCRMGLINLCENMKNLGCGVDGGMAEYIAAPEKLVYKISKKVPAYVASLAEPLACVLNGTTNNRTHPGETVVVLGAGPIGLLYMIMYKAAGARVIVSDTNSSRLKHALDIGADIVVNPLKDNVREIVMAQTGIGADIVVDAVGILVDQGIELVRKGGRIVSFGLNDQVKTEIKQFPITFNEISIHGTYIAKGTFLMAVRIIEEGVLPIDKIVTHRIPLKEAAKGIEYMLKGEGIKVVVEM